MPVESRQLKEEVKQFREKVTQIQNDIKNNIATLNQITGNVKLVQPSNLSLQLGILTSGAMLGFTLCRIFSPKAKAEVVISITIASSIIVRWIFMESGGQGRN